LQSPLRPFWLWPLCVQAGAHPHEFIEARFEVVFNDSAEDHGN
jgi:ABC-type uncharacterized transport system substrate-binding protein